MYINVCQCIYVRVYICTYARMYICTYVRMDVCTYVRMYVCMYVCINDRMYMSLMVRGMLISASLEVESGVARALVLFICESQAGIATAKFEQ